MNRNLARGGRRGGTTFAQRWSWPIRIKHRSLTAAFLAVLTCTLAGAADEPPKLVVGPEIDAPAAVPATDPDSNDLAALRALADETVAAMQQAQAGFAAGAVSDESDALQSGILERLERLSELARQQSQVTTAGRSAPSQGGGSRSNSTGDGQGAAGRNLDAAESSQAATGESSSAGAQEASVRDLTTSVWGHLPARQRDRMQSRFSDRFLPQYDQLVRQYYEALATDGQPVQ